jgi:hypothetical protein
MTDYTAAIDAEAAAWAAFFKVTDEAGIERRRQVMRANVAVGYVDPLIPFLPKPLSGGKMALAAAVLAIVSALSSPASADTISTSCRSASAGGVFARACTTTIEREAPPPAADDTRRGAATTELVQYDVAEAARRLAIPKHDPHPEGLCPIPRHMTWRDGCQ